MLHVPYSRAKNCKRTRFAYHCTCMAHYARALNEFNLFDSNCVRSPTWLCHAIVSCFGYSPCQIGVLHIIIYVRRITP